MMHGYESPREVRGTNGQLVGTLPRSLWWAITEHVITGLVLLAIWHSVYEWFLKKDARDALEHDLAAVYEKLVRDMGISVAHTALTRNASGIGLDDIYQQEFTKPYTKDLILNSSKLTIAFGSGEAWIARHGYSLQKRFSDPTKITDVFCVHPDSTIVPAIAAKLGLTSIQYQDNIKRSIDKLKRLNNDVSKLVIYGHSFIDCNFVCIGDGGGLFVPKFFLTGSGLAPVFELKNVGQSSFLYTLKSDIELLKSKATKL